MKQFFLLATLILSVQPSFADILKDFDSLGGNDVLLEKAQAIQPETRIEVVQDRVVKRRFRHEFSPEANSVIGGDAYLKTNNVGINYQFHINAKWSIGLKYNYAFNSLTAEGDAVINELSELTKDKNSDIAFIPEIDWPKQSYMGVVNWYPVYGKVNLHDLGVVHFDVYMLGGYGQVDLKSGNNQTTWTAGGGVGFWLSQHLTTRFEMRYQTYTTKRFTGEKAMDLTVAGFSLGYML